MTDTKDEGISYIIDSQISHMVDKIPRVIPNEWQDLSLKGIPCTLRFFSY